MRCLCRTGCIESVCWILLNPDFYWTISYTEQRGLCGSIGFGQGSGKNMTALPSICPGAQKSKDYLLEEFHVVKLYSWFTQSLGKTIQVRLALTYHWYLFSNWLRSSHTHKTSVQRLRGILKKLPTKVSRHLIFAAAPNCPCLKENFWCIHKSDTSIYQPWVHSLIRIIDWYKPDFNFSENNTH